MPNRRIPDERRGTTERRRTERRCTERRRAERRRANEARRAALEICHSVLHLALVTRAAGEEPDTVVTRTIPWRMKAMSFHSDQAVQELTDAIRTLVVEEKLAGGKLRIALSGELCVTRVVCGTTEYVRRELTQLEERSRRYLSLGAGRKALAANVQPLDARHQHALLTVTNQQTLDILVRVAATVGVQIALIEPSLVALSRTVAHTGGAKDEPYIVIHLDERSVELGISHSGRLLLDYRPGGRRVPSDVAQIVQQHLARLQRYCSRHFTFLDKPLKRVILSGDAERVQRAAASFGATSALEAQKIDPAGIDANWKFVHTPPGSDLAAALGTALTSMPGQIEREGPNLMEHLITQTREPIRPAMIKSLLPVAAVLVVAASIFFLNLRRQTGLDALHGELDALAPVRAKSVELRLTCRQIDHRLRHLRNLEAALENPSWAGILTTIGRCMPDDVWLDRLTIRDSRDVVLAGASYAESGIYEFVRWLEQAPELQNVALEGTRAGQIESGPSINFDIGLVLANLDDYEACNSKTD